MKSIIQSWNSSLKSRIAFTTLTIFIVALGTLLTYASQMLRADMERMLGEQQLSAATFVATSVNAEFEERIQLLNKVAHDIDQAMLQRPSALQKTLEQSIALASYFNAGAFVAAANGVVIADASNVVGRVGMHSSKDDAVHAALSEGKPAIGRPGVGLGMEQPTFTIAVPILNTRGKTIGALVGVINLKQPNLLDQVTQSHYGNSGGYLLIAPQHNMFVTATDRTRILQPLPAPGVNRMHDRYMRGYEGFGVAINSQGVEELTATRYVPIAGWFVVAALPTEEAFAPVAQLQRNIEISAVVLILLAGILIWWLLRQQLSPLQSTVKNLSAMSSGLQQFKALPVEKPDEIGYLVGGFNHLLGNLEKRESELKESESRFRQQFEQHSASMLLIDPETGQIVDANPAAARFYGYTLPQLRKLRISQINTQSEDEIARERMEALKHERNYFNFQHRLANGELRTVEVYSSPISIGGKQILYSIINDVTQRSQAEAMLQQQLRFARALNKIAEAIVLNDSAEAILDMAARIVGQTLAADRALIYDVALASQQIIGLSEYLNPLHPEITATKATYPLNIFSGGAAEMQRTRHYLISHDTAVNPHFAADNSGQILHVQMNIRSLLWYPFAFRDDGYHLLVLNEINSHHEWSEQELEFLGSASQQLSIALAKIQMVAARKNDEARIQYLANFDALTALPNKTQIDGRINYLIAVAKREHSQLAVMFLDLDNFKNVNDTLGHGAGDALLVEVASRLKATVRDGDTIFRQGGDEFILLLPESDVQSASYLAEKLLQAVAQPFHYEGHELSVTPSIGIALYPADGKDFKALGSNADAAMYRAKQDGRSCYRFFTAEMQTRSVRMLRLSNALRYALAYDEMQLHFQPQIALQSGTVIGAEALLRWRHPEFGNVSPAEFIPLAEDNGQILPIGEWVMRSAVQQAKRWLESGFAPLVIAVNLSAVQFRHPSLPDLVTSILDEAQLPPEYLELELTEGVAMDDPQRAVAVMNNLHERGVRMSIDDFGTGYSSLNYLKKFKVYKLKIDQSFVRDISTDPEDKAIVSAVINMAASLGMQSIAEGVETEGQLSFLREHGCNEVQGYYFSKPLAADDFAAWLTKHEHNRQQEK